MLKNNTQPELERIAKASLKHVETLNYIKRVLNAQHPLQQLGIEMPMHLTKTTQGFQAFRIRLSADLSKLILDNVDPSNQDNIQPNVFNTPLVKALSNGQKVALGLIKHKDSVTTTTTRKVAQKASKSDLKPSTHRGRPKKETK